MKSYRDVAEDLQKGNLVQLLADEAVADAPINLIYPRSQDLAPRVKVFMRFLQEKMAQLAQQMG